MDNRSKIEAVKERMLSRRAVFRGTAVATAAVTLSGCFNSPTPAVAASIGKVVALTHEVHENFPHYLDSSQYSKSLIHSGDPDRNTFNLKMNEHVGTHLDAPLHFSKDAHSVAEIPIENLVAPLAVIDIREKAAANADAEVTPDDIKAWISKYGPLPERCCVAMNSGWDIKATQGGFRNPDADGGLHFPGFHVETATMLIEEASVVGVASDTLSLDNGASKGFEFHYIWHPANRWGIECIANLSAVPQSGATIIVGVMKHRGGSGGPARIIALV